MSNWYVDSGATGTNAGTSWVNACTSFAQLLALGSPPVAGDSIFVANTHSETTAAALTLTFPGTFASPNFIYSTDKTNQPPTSADLLAGATVHTTGASALTIRGNIYCFGVTFSAGSGASSASIVVGNGASGQQFVLDNCQFILNNTSTSSTIRLGGNADDMYHVGSSFTFGSASQSLILGGRNIWKNSPSSPINGTIPTTLLTNSGVTLLFIEGVDLSALTSGHTIFTPGSSSEPQVYLKDCLINSAVTFMGAVPTTSTGAQLNVSRTDSSGTDNQFAVFTTLGAETSNTSVTRTGGSQDFSGNAFSKKIAVTANAKVTQQFGALPMTVVNTRVGSSRTVTVYGVWDAPAPNTPPNNNDIWIEVEYPKDSGDPIGGYATSAPSAGGASFVPSPIWTGSAYTQDLTSVWNGTSGFTNPTAWSMSVSFTPQIAGPLTIRVYCGKASATFYVDAAPVLS